jgi:hypothetical protein
MAALMMYVAYRREGPFAAIGRHPPVLRRSSSKRMEWTAPASTGVAMRQTAVLYHCQERSCPMQVSTIGFDLAKHVFQVHGITKDGEVVFDRAIRRAQLLQFFTNQSPV